MIRFLRSLSCLCHYFKKKVIVQSKSNLLLKIFFIKHMKVTTTYNGTAHFKNVNNYLNTNIHSHLETSGGQKSNLYLNVVHFFNTRVNLTSVAT